MRIAIVVDTFPSLSETFISNKVIELSRRGHELIVFCYKTNKEVYEQLRPDIDGVTIVSIARKSIVRYALLHPGMLVGLLADLQHAKQYLLKKSRSRLINRYKPDIVHFEFSGIGIEFLQEIPLIKAKTVVSCRGSAEKVKLLMSAERREKFGKLMQFVDAVHCVSEDMRQTIDLYCHNKEKIFINYPSINTAFFKHSKDAAPNQENIILSVGRLTFQKGYSAGLMAMKILKDEGIPFHWIIIGNGSKFEELVFKTRQLGLQNEVKFAGSGSREDVKQLMEAAKVFFLPSVYEGVANVVLEAMSMQLPVVCSRCGGMEEVITHGKDGLLAGVYDYADMANQLRILITNNALHNYIAAHSRQTIAERFSIEKQIAKFENIYCRLNGKHPVMQASAGGSVC